MIVRLAFSLTTVTYLMLAACNADAPREAAVDSPQQGTDAARDTAARDTTGRAPADSAAWIASPQRLGMIRAGMPRAELITVVGRPARAGYDTQESCTYVIGTALPKGVQVMVVNGVVARIDVLEPGVPTLEGVGVGSTEQDVLARYRGDATVTPHKYSGPEWHYVTVTPPSDTLHRIVFETDGAVVKNYRVGRMPEVQWVEGCS